MFSSRLRRSSLWQSIPPGFSEQKSQDYKEIDTDQYDIAVSDACDQASTHILLISEVELANEYKRLDKWLDKHTEVYRIVMLVTTENSQSTANILQQIQLHILNTGKLVPVLLVAGGKMILPTIKALSAKSYPQNVPDTIRPNVEDVMSYCTSFAPHKMLSKDEARILKQVCGSIEGLEKATRTIEGQKILYQHFASETVEGLIQFWQDEWIV